MKRLIFILPMLLLLTACGSGSKGGGDESGMRSLQANEPAAGEIASVGEVDWYTYQVAAPNTLLQIFCNSETMRPDVDLLINVYEEDADGNKVPIFGTHAAEGATVPADLQINLFVDEPKVIYIAVRDLQDNEAAPNETYYVRVTEAEAADGNETFAQADQLVVDDETSCKEDNIGDVGDTDCYTFDVVQEGIYVAKVDFNRFAGGTNVNLAVELYDDEGNELARLTQGQGEQYYLQHHLDVGTYYLLVEDQGQDDSDAASTFNVCVESLSVGEVGLNDTRESAQTLTANAGVFEVEGSLDYEGDSDWYLLPVGAMGTSGLKILHLSFDDGTDPVMFSYQVNIDNGEGAANSLLSHTYAGGSSAYLTQVKAGNGDHYLHIQAAPGQNANQSAPYTATVTVVDVDDPPEITGDGNDSVLTADALTSGVAAPPGKVSYRGDEDWFSIEVDLSTTKVLSVDLTTNPGAEDSHVEYYLSVMRDGVLKTLVDDNGEDGATHLKTSLLVPQDSGTATYLFKVCDYQGNEGDLFDYELLVTVSEIPAAVPAGPGAADYFDEVSEGLPGVSMYVELENTAIDQPHHNPNDTLFDISNASQTANLDGTTTIVFDWVAGYIDYQGDQDWFKMPLDALDPNDDDWYYDVDVELVQVVSSGVSDVEFVWKLYRDHNENGNRYVLVDRPTSHDGYVGAVGDTDPVDTAAYSINTATLDEDLWIGDGWGADNYFISISDFNYVRIDNGDGTSRANNEPDDDWSNTAAYYFQVTLTYHPGISRPE